MLMEWHANTHTLSISNMLTITILANNIIFGNLYYVNIFQNTHLATYDETHMHTPPKSVHPIMNKFHTFGRK